MSFLLFLLYYFICTIILVIIGVLLYKFYLKKKCSDISKFTEKQIDKYFNSYDNKGWENLEICNLNDLFDNFEDSKDNKSFLKKVGK